MTGPYGYGFWFPRWGPERIPIPQNGSISFHQDFPKSNWKLWSQAWSLRRNGSFRHVFWHFNLSESLNDPLSWIPKKVPEWQGPLKGFKLGICRGTFCINISKEFPQFFWFIFWRFGRPWTPPGLLELPLSQPWGKKQMSVAGQKDQSAEWMA